MGTLHENLLTFMIILSEFFLEWEMYQKNVAEKIKTHFGFNNFFPKIMLFYEIMWKNMVKPDKLQMTI